MGMLLLRLDIITRVTVTNTKNNFGEAYVQQCMTFSCKDNDND